MQTALGLRGPHFPPAGLEVPPEKEALVQQFQSRAELSLPCKVSPSYPLSACLRVALLQEHRFSTLSWRQAHLWFGPPPFWPISCHFSELHQLGTQPHEHQDQPKGSNRNKTGGEVRPSPFSGSKLVMKLHLSLTKFN